MIYDLWVLCEVGAFWLLKQTFDAQTFAWICRLFDLGESLVETEEAAAKQVLSMITIFFNLQSRKESTVILWETVGNNSGVNFFLTMIHNCFRPSSLWIILAENLIMEFAFTKETVLRSCASIHHLAIWWMFYSLTHLVDLKEHR